MKPFGIWGVRKLGYGSSPRDWAIVEMCPGKWKYAIASVIEHCACVLFLKACGCIADANERTGEQKMSIMDPGVMLLR